MASCNRMDYSSIREAMLERLLGAGLRPGELIVDGQLQRCPIEGKPRGRDGAYVAHADTPASVWWQNFVTGDTGTWTAQSSGRLSPEERETLRRRIEQDRAAREKAQGERHAAAADKAKRILERAKPCPADHPYLTAKGVRPVEGMRFTRFNGQEAIVFPLMNERGEVVSLQSIFEDGSKRLLAGGRKLGCYFPIRGEDGPLILCEGLATGLSLHEVSGWSVLVAVDAGNLQAVARMARERYPGRDLVLCADNDVRGDDSPNTGVVEATKASLAVGGLLAVPTMPNGTKCDWNDVAVELGLDEVRRQLDQAVVPESPQPEQEPPKEEGQVSDPFDRGPFFRPISELLACPTPTDWLVQGFLDAGCLAEIFGESGSMKSFVAIDLAVSVACENEWHGHPVRRNGPVFYVAAEGQGGLRKRVLARVMDAGLDADEVPLFISRGGLQGIDAADVQRVVDEIHSLAAEHGTPALVAVDTVARCMAGADENSAKDMGAFIQGMDAIRTQLGCAVLLVHHSGLQDKGRGRGSTALKGAVDWEFALLKNCDTRTLSCKKSKDFEEPEDLHFSYREVELPAPWIEADGSPMTSLVLDLAEAPVPKQSRARLSGQKLIARDALGECIHEATKGRDMTGEPAPRIHIDRWRAMAYRRGISQGDQGAKQRAFHRAVQDLITMKVVEADGDLYALM